ncbi:4Fe-4S dicluster domain-containing protein [Massilia sp. TSP1-1-2]|uniref:4Fe-4S dicluster domain-containing protein n=1 Tax=Massilia sp. TSP1-1-2 TaxID=2804649 RepID=UPI003CF3DCDD
MNVAVLSRLDSAPRSPVQYRSNGELLIVGPAALAMPLAEQLAAQLLVTVVLTDGPLPPSLPGQVRFPVHAGRAPALRGWLGAFEAQWQDWKTPSSVISLHVDLVLDVQAAPLFSVHVTPRGYFRPGSDAGAQQAAAAELVQLVGQFEKPRFFQYKERLCAHSRNAQPGCSKCIDVCSAQAISSAGERIAVNPHLCAGCGACCTVCPSGALAYDFPPATTSGEQIKTAIDAHFIAHATAPQLVFHAQAEDWPEQVIGIAVQDISVVGMDLWLAALAYGAGNVTLLCPADEAPQSRSMLRDQVGIAQVILGALGYEQGCISLLENGFEPAITPAPVPVRAKFNVAVDKRTTLDLALSHLYEHAPSPQQVSALPAGSPYGALALDKAACTLCMSCVGACPAAALQDGASAPQLRFIEANCVQCSLCVNTCPEDALTLVPRLSFSSDAKRAVVINETAPFCCIRCGKPFGTLKMVETMLAKLGQHSAFRDHPERMQMCGDCRVIDMMKAG